MHDRTVRSRPTWFCTAGIRGRRNSKSPLKEDHTMSTKSLKNNSASKLLVASALAVFLAGTGLAAAQVADDPPGSAFQDQGIRESNGYSVFEDLGRLPRAATIQNAFGPYAYTPGRAAVRHHKAARHNS
jgi:hypothetical protein